MTTDAQRKEMQRLMRELVNSRGRVHYAEVRPMRTRSIHRGKLWRELHRRGGITMDCSESVTLICRLAGLRDPNGLNYNGEGFTGTLLRHLHHYSDPAAAQPGALLVLGGGDGEHVCMVYKHDPHNPVLFSHGTEADPRFYSLETMLAAFPGKPHTFLGIDRLGFGS